MQLQGPIVAASPDGPPLVPASPQPFQVLANDGNYLRRLTTADTMLIGPSSRPRDPRHRAACVPGTYALNQLSLSDTGCIQGQVEQTLATVNSSGPRVDAKPATRSLPDQQRDLRNDEIDTRHRIVYSQDSPESKSLHQRRAVHAPPMT